MVSLQHATNGVRGVRVVRDLQILSEGKRSQRGQAVGLGRDNDEGLPGSLKAASADNSSAWKAMPAKLHTPALPLKATSMATTLQQNENPHASTGVQTRLTVHYVMCIS